MSEHDQNCKRVTSVDFEGVAYICSPDCPVKSCEYTQEPWHKGGAIAGLETEHVAVSAGRSHAAAFFGRDAEANAKLFMVAADALGVLRRALEEKGHPLHVPGCIDVDNTTEHPCCWVYAARRVIAEFEGKTL